MLYILKTERLTLRKFNINDAKFILELLNSPLWLRFIGDRNVKSLEEAEIYLRNGILKNYENLGYGFYMVEENITAKSIGMCGFVHREELELPDMGFAFLPDYPGKGYGYEIALPTLEYGKSTLKLGKICAIVNPENIASNTLLKKIGFQFIQKIEFGEKKELLNYYEV